MKKSGSREKAVEDGRSVEKKQCGQKKVRSLKTLRHQKGDDEGRAHVVNKAQKIRGFLRVHPPVSREIRQHLGPHGKAAEETDEAGIASQGCDRRPDFSLCQLFPLVWAIALRPTKAVRGMRN